jgi:hypothetical protein
VDEVKVELAKHGGESTITVTTLCAGTETTSDARVFTCIWVLTKRKKSLKEWF